MKAITIIITDDHAMLRQSMAELFNSDKRFRVVAQCSSGEEAVAKARSLQPDIVLMDVNLPGMNGFEASKIIAAANNNIKVLGVSMNAEHIYASKMIQSGAMGYVTKNSPAPELFKAVIEIYYNRKYICSDIKDQLSKEMLEPPDPVVIRKQLSIREIEIISYIRKGLTSREIAAELGLSVKTVEAHRSHILKKLELPNVAALVDYTSHLF